MFLVDNKARGFPGVLYPKSDVVFSYKREEDCLERGILKTTEVFGDIIQTLRPFLEVEQRSGHLLMLEGFGPKYMNVKVGGFV